MYYNDTCVPLWKTEGFQNKGLHAPARINAMDGNSHVHVCLITFTAVLIHVCC